MTCGAYFVGLTPGPIPLFGKGVSHRRLLLLLFLLLLFVWGLWVPADLPTPCAILGFPRYVFFLKRVMTTAASSGVFVGDLCDAWSSSTSKYL